MEELMKKIIVNVLVFSSLLVCMNNNASDAGNVNEHENDRELAHIENARFEGQDAFLEHIICMIQQYEEFNFLDELEQQDGIDTDRIIHQMREGMYLKDDLEAFFLKDVCDMVHTWLDERQNFIVLEALVEDFDFQHRPIIVDFIKNYATIVCEKKGYVIEVRPLLVTLIKRLEEHLFLNNIHGNVMIRAELLQFVEQHILTEEEMQILENEFNDIELLLERNVPLAHIIAAFPREVAQFIENITLFIWEEMGNEVQFVHDAEGNEFVHFVEAHVEENEDEMNVENMVEEQQEPERVFVKRKR